MTRKIYLKWYWMPASVLLLGLLSVVLLVWTDRIHDKQHIKNLTIDAIMDLQIHTATFHLWFEETIEGDSQQDMKDVWKDYGRAVKAVEALLSGGETEHGPISRLIDTDQRNRAESIKTLLTNLQTIARVRSATRAGIGSDLDYDFDRVFGNILVEAVGLENAVSYELVRSEQLSDRLFFGISLVWAIIVLVAALGLMNRERKREASEEALRSAHAQLLSQAEELKGHREHLTELVDTRTRELTSANRRLVLEVVERTQAEEALKESQKEFRYISSRLLSVQEEERRKISRELHDELGQSLTLMKLQLRSVERQLREDQGPLREECGNILRYLNTVIENVRRLSKDLSPVILEDLGLTRALRWLVDSFSNNYDIRLVVDVADIDRLFSANAQRSIYRVLQEALTNIVKHSGAGGASVAVRREGEGIVFSIEDKGKGFDMTEVAAQHAAERGLGLASMEERVSMLGGTLTLWSEQGKGTRISFSIPSQEEEGSHESLSHRTG